MTHRSGGGAAPDAITVDTAAVPPSIEKIVVTASLDGGGRLRRAPAHRHRPRRRRRRGDRHLRPAGLGPETALVVVEVYRRGGAWKVRAVGQGYANGLAGIATDFGVNVEEPAAAAPQAAAPQPPHARRRPPPTRRVTAPPPRRPPPAPARRRPGPEDQPGQGPGQPPEERDGLPGQGRQAAAVLGPDGPGLGAGLRRPGHRPGRLGHRLRPAAQPSRPATSAS